ncbi:hypothetical protein LTR56_025789 [Elasticomyces elasticus]|nr:hypothetical protein LTR56_025789 [Elasticomyces elasticus]KAK3619726.1 hypothetical protein LTR22_025882 [Elasticomyces elasticus]KAK4904152.1 hypothetical protein LTR49_026349 [Elasticomyces elasticus]KAK5738883.1 hypothetical protein LTS12_025450 [Elasticomyces elasticus]
MAAMSTLQGKVFDLFQLPRELRDFVYAGLTCDIIVQGKEQGIQRAIIHNAPIEKLFTLNRQFNDEYDQYVRKASQMVIEDGIAISHEPIPLGKRACGVKRVEIRLLMFANKIYGALEELTDHEEWVIATIQSLAKLESIVCSYNICVADDGTWLEEWQKEPFRTPFEAFIGHSSVTTLNHRAYSTMDEPHYFDFFALPPEMRDAIYELLVNDRLEIQQRRKGLPEPPVTVTLRNSTYSHLLTVSKQFGHEYRQRVHPFTTLEFEDNGKTIDTRVLVPPLIPLKVAFKLLILETYAHIDQIQMHRTWITSMLAKMEHPASLTIHMHVGMLEQREDTDWQAHSQERFPQEA